MLQTVLRFIIGGMVVAVVPLLAKQFGPTLAGIVMLVPATAVMSSVFTGASSGDSAVASIGRGGLIGLLPLTCFLLILSLSAQVTSYKISIVLAIGGWVAGVLLSRTSTTGIVGLASIAATLWGISLLGSRYALYATVILFCASIVALGLMEKYGITYYPLLVPTIFSLAILTRFSFLPSDGKAAVQ